MLVINLIIFIILRLNFYNKTNSTYFFYFFIVFSKQLRLNLADDKKVSAHVYNIPVLWKKNLFAQCL